MEEAPENSKESSHSAHANGMNEWMNEWMWGVQKPSDIVSQLLFHEQLQTCQSQIPFSVALHSFFFSQLELILI